MSPPVGPLPLILFVLYVQLYSDVTHDVSDIFLHERFYAGSLHNDIALIRSISYNSILYNWLHKNSSFTVHSFNEHFYISIPECTGS